MNRYRYACLFIICLACTEGKKEKSPDVSFYYWRTVFQLDSVEHETLAANSVNRLYVRYFDVTMRNGQPAPESPVVFQESPSQEIVPVVFVKNEVMLAPDLDAKGLAEKVVGYVEQINAKHSLAYNSLQIDCDWTLRSRDNYFRFLEHVKSRSGEKVTVTIRLHQVKYAQRTGIPPVKGGVLMYYNMGMIAPDSSNSIYDRKTASRYLSGLKDYPLSLDVALPVFSWGIHIRNNKVIDLLNKSDEDTFQNDTAFVARGPHYYEALQNTIRSGYYFQKGDLVKMESIVPGQLEEMAEDLSQHLSKKPSEIIFYDLDPVNLRHYENKPYFQEVSDTF